MLQGIINLSTKGTTMLKKMLLNLVFCIGGIIVVTSILRLSGFQFSYKAAALSDEKYINMFSQNDILFYKPDDCLGSNGGTINVDSSFRIDSSVDAMSFWYAEGCIDNDTCAGLKYYGGVTDMDGTMRIPMVVAQANPGLLEKDTKTDFDFGGMQYIYAENYDIQFDAFKGWMTVFTKKPGANSTRKYYWIVLPDRAYMSVAGDTYVATFENLSEPVFFIALDAHACEHQSEGYCKKAAADPDGVKIGKQFLGAFTRTGGDYTEVANITGRLTSFHRLNGRGEVIANEVAGNRVVAGGGASSNNSNCASYGDKYPQYWQHNYADSDHENSDHDWTQDTYNGGSFGANACGPTSMAMLATVATGKDIYPHDVAKFGNYVIQSPTVIDPLVGEEYGFEVIPESYSSKTDAYDKIKDYLNKGYMIHLSGEGCHDGFATVKSTGTCTDGHYIGIFSIDSSDKVWVANSSYMGNSQVDLQSIIDAIHNSVFTAIKGSGSGGKCNNGNYCSTKTERKNSLVGEAANIQLEERMNYLFPNGAPTSESAMSAYLENIEVPIKNEYGTETTMSLTVHKKLSSEIKAVFQDILAVDNFRVKAAETAAYKWRKMASGTGSLSHHSYGVAIDLNWMDNPAVYTEGTYNPGGNYYSVTDEIVQIWKKHGFYWGGDWDGRYRDYMHFTYTDH